MGSHPFDGTDRYPFLTAQHNQDVPATYLATFPPTPEDTVDLFSRMFDFFSRCHQSRQIERYMNVYRKKVAPNRLTTTVSVRQLWRVGLDLQRAFHYNEVRFRNMVRDMKKEDKIIFGALCDL